MSARELLLFEQCYSSSSENTKNKLRHVDFDTLVGQ